MYGVSSSDGNSPMGQSTCSVANEIMLTFASRARSVAIVSVELGFVRCGSLARTKSLA